MAGTWKQTFIKRRVEDCTMLSNHVQLVANGLNLSNSHLLLFDDSIMKPITDQFPLICRRPWQLKKIYTTCMSIFTVIFFGDKSLL
jgi:hypothetical protein